MSETFFVCENQRRLTGFGEWSSENLSSLFLDPPPWADENQKPIQKDSIQLPQDGQEWSWRGEWKIVLGQDRDSQGWQYSFKWPDFVVGFKPTADSLCLVRRRTWSRTCNVVPKKQNRPNPPTKLRDYLFEGASSSSSSSSSSNNSSSQPNQSDQTEQQIQESLKLSKEASESSKRALRKAQETEEIAASTMASLHAQSEQLRRVEKGLDEVDTHSKQAERIISGMQSIPATIANAFKPKVQPVITDNSKFYEPKKPEKHREEATRSETERGNGVKDKQKQPLGVDYSQSFGERGQQIHRNMSQADQHIEQLDESVARLKVIALEMGTQLDAQAQHLDHLNERAERTVEGVKKNRREMRTVH